MYLNVCVFVCQGTVTHSELKYRMKSNILSPQDEKTHLSVTLYVKAALCVCVSVCVCVCVCVLWWLSLVSCKRGFKQERLTKTKCVSIFGHREKEKDETINVFKKKKRVTEEQKQTRRISKIKRGKCRRRTAK